jgi:hemolysin activation/secretion protein
MSIEGKPGLRLFRVLIIVASWEGSLAVQQVGVQPPPTVPLGRPGGELLELPAYEEPEEVARQSKRRLAGPENEESQLPTQKRLESQLPPPELPLGLPGQERPGLPPYKEPDLSPGIKLPPVEPVKPEELADTFRVFVRKFKIEGNTIFSDKELGKVTTSYENREITSSELENLRLKLTRYYTERGYLNSGAFIPDQKVVDGIITIRIVEGVLSKIEIAGNQRLRRYYIETRVDPGKDVPLNVNILQERLQLLQQDRRIERVDAKLRPGTLPGEAELDVDVEEARPVEFWLTVDNGKPPSVGSVQGRMRAVHNDLFGFGDTLVLDYALTEGLDDFFGSYLWPVTASDTTFEFVYRTTDADVVEDPFERLDIKNKTKTFRAALVHPVFRTLNTAFKLGVLLDIRHSKSFLLGERFSLVPASENGEINLTVPRVSQDWVSRSRTQVLAARSLFSLGIDAFDATVNSRAEDGKFFAWLGQFQWARRYLNPEVELLVRTDLQVANDSLPPVEKFAVGGINTVRGYRENQLVRDNGFIGSLELRIPVYRSDFGQHSIQIAPFFDYGRSWNTDRSTPDPDDIYSAGLGLRLTIASQIQALLYWGYAFRDIRNASDDLQDDGIHFRVVAKVF